MRTYNYKGDIVYPKKELVLEDGTRYPRNAWSKLPETTLTDLGVTWVDTPDPEPYDSRYYQSAGNPKDLDTLKMSHIDTIKQQANSLLSHSDWMVTRETTRNVPIPNEVRAYREAVVAYSETVEAIITACENVDELSSLQHTWPEEDADYSDWVPTTITKLQAIEYLDELGKLNDFILMIDSDVGMQVRFDAASVLDRNNKLLLNAAPLLELDLDDFFREAVKPLAR